MGDSTRDGRMSAGDYCIMMMVMFQTWTPLMMCTLKLFRQNCVPVLISARRYTSRFHAEDVLTNVMYAAHLPPP
jgi:hypothetical protein